MATRPSDLRALLEAVAGRHHVVVLTHNDPDPDALATAFGLATLLRRHGHAATLTYGGLLGRAENRAMVRILRLRFRVVDQLAIADFDAVALVDTQPTAGNHSLPPTIEPRIVLDHHGRRRSTGGGYHDVRPSYGACATIVGEYLQVAGVPWNERLATALFYGIKSDTLGLARGAHEADATLYLALHQSVNQSWIGQIEQAPLSWFYYQALQRGLTRARVNGKVVLTHLDEIHRPDIVGELADLLLRAEGIEWSVVTGQFSGQLVLSVRTRNEVVNAATLVREAVGTRGSTGGHGHMAGGRLPLAGRDPTVERERIEARLLTALGADRRRPRLLVPEALS